MKIKILLCVFALTCLSAKYNLTSAQEKPEDITAHFFQLFQEQSSDAAVDYFFSTNKWLNNDKTSQDNIKLQLKKGIAMLGQYYGYELIEKIVYTENYMMFKLYAQIRQAANKVYFCSLQTKPDLANTKPEA